MLFWPCHLGTPPLCIFNPCGGLSFKRQMVFQVFGCPPENRRRLISLNATRKRALKELAVAARPRLRFHCVYLCSYCIYVPLSVCVWISDSTLYIYIPAYSSETTRDCIQCGLFFSFFLLFVLDLELLRNPHSLTASLPKLIILYRFASPLQNITQL